MPDENDPTSPIDPLAIGEALTLTEAAKLSGFNSDFLRQLAIKGRLKAKKSGSIWLTTLAAIEEYKNGRSSKNIAKKYRDRS